MEADLQGKIAAGESQVAALREQIQAGEQALSEQAKAAEQALAEQEKHYGELTVAQNLKLHARLFPDP